MRPGRVWSMGSFLALGWGKAWLWGHPAWGRMPGRQGRETLLPSRFPSPAPAGWGCSPGSPHPFSHPGHAHAWLALAPSCPPACLPSLFLPARAPRVVTASPWACPAGWLQGWLWAELRVPLSSLSLQWHLCHQVAGLAPEPCQPLQPCPLPGTPGIQALVLMAPGTCSQG